MRNGADAPPSSWSKAALPADPSSSNHSRFLRPAATCETTRLPGTPPNMLIFAVIVFYAPNLFGNPDNYVPANPLVTPAHVVPEWYFLPYYAILRAIPSKLGGVIAMFSSIAIFQKSFTINAAPCLAHTACASRTWRRISVSCRSLIRSISLP